MIRMFPTHSSTPHTTSEQCTHCLSAPDCLTVALIGFNYSNRNNCTQVKVFLHVSILCLHNTAIAIRVVLIRHCHHYSRTDWIIKLIRHNMTLFFSKTNQPISYQTNQLFQKVLSLFVGTHTLILDSLINHFVSYVKTRKAASYFVYFQNVCT